MAKFIVVSHPHSYDTYITEFDTLDEALEHYREYIHYDSELILAQVMDVTISAEIKETLDKQERLRI